MQAVVNTAQRKNFHNFHFILIIPLGEIIMYDCYNCGNNAETENGVAYYRVGKENLPICVPCWKQKRSAGNPENFDGDPSLKATTKQREAIEKILKFIPSETLVNLHPYDVFLFKWANGNLTRKEATLFIELTMLHYIEQINGR